MKRASRIGVLKHEDSDGREDRSCADVAGGLVGSVRSGRRDLSTNKKLLAQAVVSNARRGRKRHADGD